MPSSDRTDPPRSPDAETPPDIGRRLFFRRFAGDVVTAAGNVMGAAQLLQQQSAEAARELLGGDEEDDPAARIEAPPPTVAGGSDPRSAGMPTRCTSSTSGALPESLVEISGDGGVRGGLRDQGAHRPRGAGHRTGRGDRYRADHGAARGVEAVRASGVAPRGGERASQRATHGREPGLGDGPDARPLRGDRRGRCRWADRGRRPCATRRMADRPRGDDRPRTAGGVRRSGAAGHRGPPAADPDALQHGAARMRRIRHGAGRRPGGASRRAGAPRVGRRDAAGAPGRSPHDLGAGAGGGPHTLVADAAAATLLARGEVDVVLVGADRVAADGDTANKLGTYPLAVLAARHGVPFYVCAPVSTLDPATPDGAAIHDRGAQPPTRSSRSAAWRSRRKGRSPSIPPSTSRRPS